MTGKMWLPAMILCLGNYVISSRWRKMREKRKRPECAPMYIEDKGGVCLKLSASVCPLPPSPEVRGYMGSSKSQVERRRRESVLHRSAKSGSSTPQLYFHWNKVSWEGKKEWTWGQHKGNEITFGTHKPCRPQPLPRQTNKRRVCSRAALPAVFQTHLNFFFFFNPLFKQSLNVSLANFLFPTCFIDYCALKRYDH